MDESYQRLNRNRNRQMLTDRRKYLQQDRDDHQISIPKMMQRELSYDIFSRDWSISKKAISDYARSISKIVLGQEEVDILLETPLDIEQQNIIKETFRV